MSEPLLAASIILRTRPLRDADLIVTFLTRDHGKIVGVANHARRSRKRFGGGLEPGTVVDFRYRDQPQRELAQLEDLRVIAGPPKVARDLSRFAALGVTLDIVERMSMERQAASDKFDLIRATLQHLPHADSDQLMTHFLAQWLRLAGFTPAMAQCARCDDAIAPQLDTIFAPGEGGALCVNCGRSRGWSMPLTAETRRYWSADAHGSLPDAATRQFLRVGIRQYLHHVLGKDLASAPYWDMVWQVVEKDPSAA